MDDEEVTPRSGELPTSNYGWLKPTVGDTDDAWGAMLNADLDGIDSVVAAKLSDAPNNTNTYGRKGGAWSIITGASVTVSDTAPSSPSAGALWWDSVGGQLYIWYTDPNTSQWVPTANQLGGGYLLKQGVTDGSDAPAGQIGEVISSVVTTGVALANSSVVNITSVILTPGDWDVQGEVWVNNAGGGLTSMMVVIGNVSATIPANVAINSARVQVNAALAAANNMLSAGPLRASLTTITTFYLIAQAGYGAGSATGTGKIWARRAR